MEYKTLLYCSASFEYLAAKFSSNKTTLLQFTTPVINHIHNSGQAIYAVRHPALPSTKAYQIKSEVYMANRATSNGLNAKLFICINISPPLP